MKIGFDAKRAFCNASGLGNYSRNLLQNLFQFFPENEYLLFTPRAQDRHWDPRGVPQSQVITPQTFTSKTLPSLWRGFLMGSEIRQRELDVYHGLSHELPVTFNQKAQGRKIPQVVTMHDLIYLRYPEYFPWVDRVGYHLKFKYACRHADHIVAVSEQTKDDLIEFFKTPESKISVVYQNCGPQYHIKYSEAALLSLRERFSLERPFALFVGNIEPRKNCLGLVQAFAQLPKDLDVELIFVGGGKQYKKEIQNYIEVQQLGHRIRFLGYVPHDDLPGLYQAAHLFVYPSFFEGYGIPLVEALSSGTPVITSRQNPFQEIVGPAGLLVNPRDQEELTEALFRLFSDSELRQNLVAEGMLRLPLFDSKKVTQEMMDIYCNLTKSPLAQAALRC
jgi:glycosyltransferase involved in cell wall biosynthesis